MKNLRRIFSLFVVMSTALASLTFIFDGRDLTGGVWLCAAWLAAIFYREDWS